MVCETRGGVRPLSVSRRGGFFEDPFFADAWGDYSSAVRRIVDRFNHGWLGDRSTGPSRGRRDDDQATPGYHSLYRSLRAARMSYASQSAKFKEEGGIYKLVMDVREFVGGDVTVRTAGGTVSVRGKVDVSLQNPAIRKFDRSQERCKKNRSEKADDDSDADSVASGASTSTKTLHRRFTLPPDADCEKVRSMLSKDAILTVTIPKRNDVRVIPVRMEGQDAPAEERGRSRRKRPSTSEPASPLPTKKAQAETGSHFMKPETSADFSGEKRDFCSTKGANSTQNSSARTKFGKTDSTEKEPNTSRKTTEKSEGRSIFIDGYQKKSTDYSASNGRRESLTNVHHRPSSESPFTQQQDSDVKGSRRSSSARRNSKYEQAHEVTIPVRLEKTRESKDPPSSAEKKTKVYDIKIQREECDTSNGATNKENEAPRKRESASYINGSESNTKNQSSIFSSDNKHINGAYGVQEDTTKCAFEDNKHKISNDEKEEKVAPKSFYYFGDAPKKTDSQDIQTKTTVQPEAPTKRVSLTSELLRKHDLKDSRDGHRRSLDSSKLYSQNFPSEVINCNSSESGMSTTSSVTSKETTSSATSSAPSTSSDYSTPKKAFTPPESPAGTPTKPNNPSTKRKISAPTLLSDIGNHNPSSSQTNSSHKRVPLQILKPQEQCEDPNQSNNEGQNVKRKMAKSTPSSPPLGKEVRVEHRQSYMEDDLFKDCWRDYSNTLQDVLSRLQELSSELGQTPKFLVSSPNRDPDVPFPGTNAGSVNGELKNFGGQSFATAKQKPPPDGSDKSSSTTTSAQEAESEQSASVPASPTSTNWNGLGSSNISVNPSTPTVSTPDSVAQTLLSPGDANSSSTSYFSTPSSFTSQPLNSRANDPSSPPWRSVGDRNNLGTKPSSPSATADRISTTSGKARHRPTSLHLNVNGNDYQSGSLLQNLRKNSPVEALQERYMRQMSPTTKSSLSGVTGEGTVHLVPVEVAGGGVSGGGEALDRSSKTDRNGGGSCGIGTVTVGGLPSLSSSSADKKAPVPQSYNFGQFRGTRGCSDSTVPGGPHDTDVTGLRDSNKGDNSSDQPATFSYNKKINNPSDHHRNQSYETSEVNYRDQTHPSRVTTVNCSDSAVPSTAAAAKDCRDQRLPSTTSVPPTQSVSSPPTCQTPLARQAALRDRNSSAGVTRLSKPSREQELNVFKDRNVNLSDVLKKNYNGRDPDVLVEAAGESASTGASDLDAHQESCKSALAESPTPTDAGGVAASVATARLLSAHQDSNKNTPCHRHLKDESSSSSYEEDEDSDEPEEATMDVERPRAFESSRVSRSGDYRPQSWASDSTPGSDHSKTGLAVDAERIIEQTRRLSSTTLNNLDNPPQTAPKSDLYNKTRFNFDSRESSRDTRESPESNTSVEADSLENEKKCSNEETSSEESVICGRLSFPLEQLKRPNNLQNRQSSRAEQDQPGSDAADRTRPLAANEGWLHNDDVMAAKESRLPEQYRSPYSSLASEKQRDPICRLHESSQPDMGGVFSKGRTRGASEPSITTLPATPLSPVTTNQVPLRPQRRERLQSDEDRVPPYVTQKTEPQRRYSGFNYVTSDNVRRMRDVWGSLQEKPPLSPGPGTPPSHSRGLPAHRSTPASPRYNQQAPSSPFSRKPTHSPTSSRPPSPGSRNNKRPSVPTAVQERLEKRAESPKAGRRSPSPSPNPYRKSNTSAAPEKGEYRYQSPSTRNRTPSPKLQRKNGVPSAVQERLAKRAESPTTGHRSQSPSPYRKSTVPSAVQERLEKRTESPSSRYRTSSPHTSRKPTVPSAVQERLEKRPESPSTRRRSPSPNVYRKSTVPTAVQERLERRAASPSSRPRDSDVRRNGTTASGSQSQSPYRRDTHEDKSYRNIRSSSATRPHVSPEKGRSSPSPTKMDHRSSRHIGTPPTTPTRKTFPTHLYDNTERPGSPRTSRNTSSSTAHNNNINKTHHSSRASPARDSPTPRTSSNRTTSRNRTSSTSSNKTSTSNKGSSGKSKAKSSSQADSKSAPSVHKRIFKRFRDASLRPDSETLCFVEHEDRYKMVLDVAEFVAGEVEVLQDDKVLTVKGSVETQEGEGQSAVRTFHRTFSIPQNSKEEDIDSALSEDGILTIFVPKKKERVIKIELVD